MSAIIPIAVVAVIAAAAAGGKNRRRRVLPSEDDVLPDVPALESATVDVDGLVVEDTNTEAPLFPFRDVKDVQEALMAAGYALPNYGADGDWGPESQAAIEAFVADSGGFAGGVGDEILGDDLEALAEASAGNPVPLTPTLSGAFCDISEWPPCGDQLAECIPLWAEGEAPPGYQDVGMCIPLYLIGAGVSMEDYQPGGWTDIVVPPPGEFDAEIENMWGEMLGAENLDYKLGEQILHWIDSYAIEQTEVGGGWFINVLYPWLVWYANQAPGSFNGIAFPLRVWADFLDPDRRHEYIGSMDDRILDNQGELARLYTIWESKRPRLKKTVTTLNVFRQMLRLDAEGLALYFIIANSERREGQVLYGDNRVPISGIGRTSGDLGVNTWLVDYPTVNSEIYRYRRELTLQPAALRQWGDRAKWSDRITLGDRFRERALYRIIVSYIRLFQKIYRYPTMPFLFRDEDGNPVLHPTVMTSYERDLLVQQGLYPPPGIADISYEDLPSPDDLPPVESA